MAFNKPGPSAPSGSMSTTEEYTVRVPMDKKKRYKMMKFSTGNDLDFVKLSQSSVKMERENNLKEFKSANDIDMMPKFGAGSEFGREQKEEARRKKYGIMAKKYDTEKQPWILKIGTGKQAKKYKSNREGTITDNASYYIFTQCSDGAFEAHPIEEWHSFTPVVKYKYLNSDEAEEEFNRRDKTMNMFGIMLRKRIRNEDTKDADPDEGETKKKSKAKSKKGKDFMLTDMEDMSDDNDMEEEEEEDGADGDEKPKKPKPKKGDQDEKKKVRNAKHNSDDEAVEESDEGDFDDKEMDYVDYMTDSSSGQSDVEVEDKVDKNDEKGVDMEDGLRKLIDSEESSEEEEEKKETQGAKDAENGKKNGSDSDSSDSTSGSDSDIEKEGINSALFLLKKSKEEKKRGSPIDKISTSRSGTPTSVEGEDKKGIKRKLEAETSEGKKMRTDSPVNPSGSSSEGITEDQIRRYLIRKPMTAKEVALKFKSKKLNMSREQMTGTIAQMLKKINPDRKLVNKKLYLSLKKPE